MLPEGFPFYQFNKFDAKLHRGGNDVTAADEYWLVALGEGSPRVGSIRGSLGRGSTIRSPELGLGSFFALLAISLWPSYTKKETM